MSREVSSQYSRNFLLAQKGAICANCQIKFLESEIEFHHIVPIAVGGYDVLTNIIQLCTDCHNLVHHGKGAYYSHSQLIKLGLDSARTTGKQIGRPKVTYNNLDEITKMYCEKINKNEISVTRASEELFISRPSMYKYLKLYNDYHENKFTED